MDDLRSLLTEEIARRKEAYPDDYLTAELADATWYRLADSEIEIFGIEPHWLPALHATYWCWQALIDAQTGTHWQKQHAGALAKARALYAHIVAEGETIGGFTDFAHRLADVPRQQCHSWYRRLDAFEIRNGEWRFED